LFFFLVVGSIAGFQRLLRIQVPPATGSPDDRHRADKADGDEKIE
jgi:hypothetical protein